MQAYLPPDSGGRGKLHASKCWLLQWRLPLVGPSPTLSRFLLTVGALTPMPVHLRLLVRLKGCSAWCDRASLEAILIIPHCSAWCFYCKNGVRIVFWSSWVAGLKLNLIHIYIYVFFIFLKGSDNHDFLSAILSGSRIHGIAHHQPKNIGHNQSEHPKLGRRNSPFPWHLIPTGCPKAIHVHTHHPVLYEPAMTTSSLE